MSLLITKKYFTYQEIAGFDVETDEDGDFYCGIITFKNSTFDKPNSYKLFLEPKNCADYLLSDYWKRGYPFAKILTGYNLAYDLNSILNYFQVNRLDRKGRFITCDYTQNIYNKGFVDKSHRSDYFQMIDLMNFFLEKPSLKDLANDFKENYIDIHDYKNEKIIEACFSHSLSARNILDHLQKLFNNYGCDLKLTATSSARKVFTSNFLNKKNQIWDTKRWDNKIPVKYSDDELFGQKRFSKLSYKGGTVEMFKKGFFKNVVLIDKVSMYPSVMYRHNYPDPNKFWYFDYKEKDKHYFESGDFLKNEGIAEIKLFIPKTYSPPFLFSIQTDLNIFVHKCDEIEGIFTYPEIAYALNLGAKVLDVYQILEFSRYENFFDAYVKEFFSMKRDKPELEKFAKLMLNGLSGGFGQTNTYQIDYDFLEDGDTIDIEDMFEYNGLKFKINKQNEEESYPHYSYPALVSYVTAYARIELHKAISKLGAENCLYCDTDSIITTNLDYKNILKIGTELDCWKKVWNGNVEIRGLKYYRYYDYDKQNWFYRIKGVPKKQQAEFWQTENIWVKKPRHFRSAIRTGKRVNEWLNINYVRNKNIKEKRKFTSNGESIPYD